MKELKTMIKTKNTKLMTNFNKALKDDEFKSFIDILGLSYEELAKYTSILQESSIEYNHCKNCKSILECKNRVNGYAYLPEVKNNQIIGEYHEIPFTVKNGVERKRRSSPMNIPNAL